jgi:hypothetical protein
MIAKFLLYFSGGTILAHILLFCLVPFGFLAMSLVVPGGSQATEGPIGPDIHHENIAWGKGDDPWTPEAPFICPGSPKHPYMRNHCTVSTFITEQVVIVIFVTPVAFFFVPIRSINESWATFLTFINIITPVVGLLIAYFLLREDISKQKQTDESASVKEKV